MVGVQSRECLFQTTQRANGKGGSFPFLKGVLPVPCLKQEGASPAGMASRCSAPASGLLRQRQSSSHTCRPDSEGPHGIRNSALLSEVRGRGRTQRAAMQTRVHPSAKTQSMGSAGVAGLHHNTQTQARGRLLLTALEMPFLHPHTQAVCLPGQLRNHCPPAHPPRCTTHTHTHTMLDEN